jgi:hypothetical protein
MPRTIIQKCLKGIKGKKNNNLNLMFGNDLGVRDIYSKKLQRQQNITVSLMTDELIPIMTLYLCNLQIRLVPLILR